jgi:hypothetical protein
VAAAMIRGSCLCGDVRLEISGAVSGGSHCHCSMCRKAHGAAFGTYALANAADFRIVSGADRITRHASSPGVSRTFCSRCGSTLQWLIETKPDIVEIALGVLDDDPGVRPARHIFVGSKAPWHEITDDLPQHATWPGKP